MKKPAAKFVFVLGLIFLNVEIYSQGVKFGGRAGVNISTYTTDQFKDEVSSLTGFHVGGIIDIGLSKHFSIVPEFLYTMKGARERFNEYGQSPNSTINISTDKKYKFSYLEIPILTTYKLESGLHFEAGPYLGILLSANEKGTEIISITGQPDETVYINEIIKYQLKNTDFGLAAGLGYQHVSGMGCAARYSRGLIDVKDPGSSDENMNSVFTFSINYLFGLK